MERVELPGWRILHDRAATVAAYAAMPAGGAEECGCDYGRNWLETYAAVLPPALLDLLGRFGIPPRRDAEVYHCGRLGPGRHYYGGWYHLVGRVEFGEQEASPPVQFGPCRVYFHSRPALLPKVFEGRPVIQMEFEAEVPWLSGLPEPE